MTGREQIVEFRPIGVIRTPFTEVSGMPIQPAGAEGVKGRIEMLPEFVEGLRDLDGFSHITLLYHLHRAKEARLTVVPFMDTVPRGVFATRAPRRPNAIGLSTVKLVSIEGGVISIENIDVLDGTPLLDIKPYFPEFDERTDVRLGWLEDAKGRARRTRSDDRFDEEE